MPKQLLGLLDRDLRQVVHVGRSLAVRVAEPEGRHWWDAASGPRYASTGTGGTTPAQAVFAAKSAYATALTAAVGYESLLRCSDTVRAPCSSPELVAQIRKADTTAKAALDAAGRPHAPGRRHRHHLEAANAALVALRAIVANTGVMK